MIHYIVFLLIIIYFVLHKNVIFNNSNITNLLFKNQYLIVKKNTKGSYRFTRGLKKTIFNTYYVYTGENTKIVNYKNSILIIGFIIDPYNYKLSNRDIAITLFGINNYRTFFKKLQTLSGRFIIFNNKLNIVCNDSCAIKKMFYYKTQIFSSSEKIILNFLNKRETISRDKQDYITSNKFVKSEHKWYSNEGYDNTILLLLPNTYLNIVNNRILRMPFFIPSIENNMVAREIGKIISNSIKALLYRKQKLIQPITSGTDSRVLLSCIKHFHHKIKFYIFSNKTNKFRNDKDSSVANRISNKFNINFKDIIINNNTLDPGFEFIFRSLHIVPRVLYKTKYIEYHYKHNNHKNIININGNCAEILKENYNNNKKINNYSSFLKAINQTNPLKYIEKSLNKYYNNSIGICNKHNIDICNLYHWELQHGLWSTLYPLEQDIAIEEFSPFNNREIILMGLKLDRDKRTIDNNFLLFQEIIKYYWKDLMFINFN